MLSKKLSIHLGHNKDYTLIVELFDNRVAHRIWEMLRNANDIEFISRTQFYEFDETIEEVEALLAEAIEHLKRLKPEDFLEYDELNRLHTNFPDILPNEDDPETRHWLSMFNYHLHHLERKRSIYKSKRQFLFSTRLPTEPLELQDYDLFTPSKKENTVYMNYPHVGKHIMELVGDNDIDVPADHIVPTNHIKADLLFHLDEDFWIGQEEQVIEHINKWLPNIADKLPYPIGDKRLAIGHIPIGKIINPDINKIKQNKYVHSVEAHG
jgi:hypothetical protein